MKLRIASVGTGNAFAHIHFPAYSRLPNLEFVGACDPFTTARDKFPMFDTVEQLIESTTPDILAILTPPATHYELCCRGLERGCHIVCEKPFVDRMDQALDIVDRARAADRLVVVNNQYRFMNTYQQAKLRIGTDEFGELLFMSAEQLFRRTNATEAGWRGQDRRRTCKEFGTHVFDLCRFFFDEDPDTVLAHMPSSNQLDGVDHLNLIQLGFSDGRVAQITLNRLSRGPHRYLDLRLDGSEGCIETKFGGRFELRGGIHPPTRRPFLSCDFSWGGSADLIVGDRVRRIGRNPLNPFADATSKLLEHFMNALSKDETPPCNAVDNCKTLAIMLGAYESVETGRTIKLDYP